MHNPLPLVVTAACVLALGACATANRPGASRDTRTYARAAEVVIEEAAAAFLDIGLNIEDASWSTDSTYVIAGYRKSALVRAGGDAVQVATLTVFIDKRSDFETRVRVVTTERDVPAAASQADRRYDDANRFLARLDARLG